MWTLLINLICIAKAPVTIFLICESRHLYIRGDKNANNIAKCQIRWTAFILVIVHVICLNEILERQTFKNNLNAVRLLEKGCNRAIFPVSTSFLLKITIKMYYCKWLFADMILIKCSNHAKSYSACIKKCVNFDICHLYMSAGDYVATIW